MPSVTPNSHLTLHYRMTLLVDGAERELVDTFGAAPATLQMGVGQWAQTIEDRLLGLEEGACLEFDLPPDQAYGVHNRELVRTVSRAQLEEHSPAGQKFGAGETVELRAAAGLPVRGVLVECDAERAVVDFNHPLAGMPMRVRVQVIGVL
jgi:FKBP-type peptidyl-prolyl cis-trans isomerase SlpA